MHDLDDEREWTVDDFIADVADITANPPAAPRGFVLVECDAEHRHWPTYVAEVDGMYPAPCDACRLAIIWREQAAARCKAKHRRWKSWNGWGWLARKGYSLGIIGGSGTSYGRCEFCGIGVQHHAPRWRGSRSYILGVSVDSWRCLFRGHRRSESVTCGLCTVCLPCPECGSTDRDHIDWSPGCRTTPDLPASAEEAGA